MARTTDPSESGRGQIPMVRRLGASISETGRLIVRSLFSIYRINPKGVNDSEVRSKRQAVGLLRVIKVKRRYVLFGKAKSTQDIDPLTFYFVSKNKRFGTHSSMDTVGYGAARKTS
ncbi:hypothetical protein TNCV_43851 [Trichonephila clavipes]|nr:hypothetical protein TNCV_43851 [Trichonephila clavipes]